MTALAALAGCLTAAGILLLLVELRPASPRLDAALARIQPTPLHPAQPSADNGGAGEQMGRWLAERIACPAGMLAVPRTDLALLGRTVERSNGSC